jgi:hypothetical protein
LIITPAGDRATLIEGRALRAAYALFQGDAGAIGRFDVTVRGFFLSFRAIFYALPAFALALAVEHRFIVDAPGFVPGDFNDVRFVAGEAFGFVLLWLAKIAILLLGARLLDRAARIVPAVIALNWASALAANLVVLPALLLLSGLLPDLVVMAAMLVLLGIVLRYHWTVVRSALRIEALPAAALVGAMLAVELLSTGLIDGLSHLW